MCGHKSRDERRHCYQCQFGRTVAAIAAEMVRTEDMTWLEVAEVLGSVAAWAESPTDASEYH